VEKSLVKISLLLFVNIVLHKLSTFFVDNNNNPFKTARSMDFPPVCFSTVPERVDKGWDEEIVDN
jgi:hypothetical protein